MNLPMLMGIITPGNRTVFLNGRIGTVSGTFTLSFSRSFSSAETGMNSDTSSPSVSITSALRFILLILYSFLF